MAAEPELYYFCDPAAAPAAEAKVPTEFVAVTDFLADEPACKMVWELLETQFRTRGKFLAIWRAVSFIAVHRDADGTLDGFLLVSAPVNWQIDYVVVRPDARGQGVAGALVRAAVAEAARRRVPYVMLTSKASLRPLYEACGFAAVNAAAPVPC
jgi:GNAT superfamily N-acetyltransferase